jgi:hypothetical protein
MYRAVWAAASESQRQERLKKEEEDKQLEAARAAEHAAHIARLCATPPPDGLPDLLPEEVRPPLFSSSLLFSSLVMVRQWKG